MIGRMKGKAAEAAVKKAAEEPKVFMRGVQRGARRLTKKMRAAIVEGKLKKWQQDGRRLSGSGTESGALTAIS